MIGRMDDQKGFDLVADVIGEWVERGNVQWAILGKGEPKYHRLFADLHARVPQKVGVRLEYSDPLAHRIEAGADLFLMPSRFEPCGLNQMYSLAYGTVPVVQETGGLADTITDASDAAVAADTANGFSFREDNALALSETLRRACDVLSSTAPRSVRRLMAIGMRQDWSWRRSAKEYIGLYEKIRVVR